MAGTYTMTAGSFTGTATGTATNTSDSSTSSYTVTLSGTFSAGSGSGTADMTFSNTDWGGPYDGCTWSVTTTTLSIADRNTAMTAISDAESYGFDNYTNTEGGWTWNLDGNVITASGPGGTPTLTITFSPSYESYTQVTMVENLSTYYDSTTGYTITGTLTWVENFTVDPETPTSMSYNGTFTLSGGIITSVATSFTYDFPSGPYGGSITVNGQTFTF
jgi:hypothetical protein